MYKFIVLLALIVFTGCSQKVPEALATSSSESHKKIFEEEDTLIMFGLRAEQVKDFRSAAKIFDTLYEKSLRKEYIHRSLQNRLYLKEHQVIIAKVDEITNKEFSDFILIRLKIIALIQSKKLKEAQALAISLVKASEDEADYLLVSDIYGAQQEYDKAVDYLQSAYLRNYSEKILDKLSLFLYMNLNKKKEAIAYLETHTRIHGSSIDICKRLVNFYSNENNAEGLLSAYLRYYELDKNQEVAKKIVQLYGFTREYGELTLFLEESKSNDVALLDLYVNFKNYIKAFPLARNIYDDTGDVKYLGESAIYEYESQVNKNDKAFLIKISKKFEEVLKHTRESLYLNYYGYILIDHDLDINQGMKYIEEALVAEPNSSYYLDSLAWGHYKLNECVKAWKVILKVRTLEGGDDPEVIKHYEIIKKCKGKSKQ